PTLRRTDRPFHAQPSDSSQPIAWPCPSRTQQPPAMLTGLPKTTLSHRGLPPPAITSSSGGTSTPTFTLPAGATSLSLVSHVNSATVCTGGSPLTSGTGHGFTASDSLDYCLASNSYPSGGISSFTVTWSQ